MQQDKIRDNKRKRTPINLSANTDYLHQFGNSTFKTQTNKT